MKNGAEFLNWKGLFYTFKSSEEANKYALAMEDYAKYVSTFKPNPIKDEIEKLNKIIDELREQKNKLNDNIICMVSDLAELRIELQKEKGYSDDLLYLCNKQIASIEYFEKSLQSEREAKEELLNEIIGLPEEWERQKGLFKILEKDGWMDLKIKHIISLITKHKTK